MPERECRICHKAFPLDTEHFYVNRWRDDGTPLFRWQCKDCYNAAHRKAYRSNPAALAERRTRWAWDARQRRRRDPEPMREAVRRYREKVRQDEAKLQARRDAARKWYARHRRVPVIGKAGAGDSKAFPKVPATPLGVLLEDHAARNGLTYVTFGKRLGISERALREWRKCGRTAYFNMADRVLSRLGLLWWEVWTEDNSTEEELALVEYAFTGEGPYMQGEQLALGEAA